MLVILVIQDPGEIQGINGRKKTCQRWGDQYAQGGTLFTEGFEMHEDFINVSSS
jgi:hypothetical protein